MYIEIGGISSRDLPLEKGPMNLQQQIDGMNDAVCGGNIRGNHVAIVHLHLAICLLQRQRRSTGHRVLDLVEAHASREQRSLDQMFRHQSLGQLLVCHQIGQLFRREFSECLVRGGEYCVRFDTCNRSKEAAIRILFPSSSSSLFPCLPNVNEFCVV